MSRDHFTTRIFAAALVAAVLFTSPPAHADMGPCKPDKHDGLICGSGDGAARVIDDTTSPSKQLALAWRTPDAPPTEEPDDDKIELVLVRLKDGAVLTNTQSSYWNTGKMHVNRLTEEASWSPNSRYVIRLFQSRFETGNVDLFVIGSNGAFAGSLELLKPMDAAIRARLKQKVKDPENYSLFLSGGKELKIGNDGLVRAKVMMWIPKEGPEHNYAVNLQVTQARAGLRAQVISVVPTRGER